MHLNNFDSFFVPTAKGDIFCKKAGRGAPLLLLHGYPQTHLMWHLVAPELLDNYTVILADLRGYGQSMVPKSDSSHQAYSKKEMARDMVNVMDFFHFKTFFVAGHDRGGRVAHRLARDFENRIKAICVLDICPTLDMYESTTMEFAKSYFHWFFLIQPYDLPERMIMSDPKKWLDNCLNKWSGGQAFGLVEKEYLKAFQDPKRIHASCEDYRASNTIDLQHDKEDRHKKLNIPLLLLWGKNGVIGNQFEPISIWQNYFSKKVKGIAMDSGHFIPEEKPQEVIKHLKDFFV